MSQFNNKTTDKESKSWLQLVTEQSWEPELLISGLAIYATLQLPELLQDAYRYYQYNLQAGTGFLDEMLPMLIFGILTTIIYLLNIVFIGHFVIRAFWVGFIGLMSVYPGGIRYENLPYSEFYKEQARKQLGSSYDLALQIDRVASMIFSIGFAVVLLFISTIFLYTLFFILYNISKLILPAGIFETYSIILFYLFISFCILYTIVVLGLNLQRFRSDPKLAKWHFNISWETSAALMPLLYRPLQFITLTFMSNNSTKLFMGISITMSLVTFLLLIWVLVGSQGVSLIDTRDFMPPVPQPQRLTHSTI